MNNQGFNEELELEHEHEDDYILGASSLPKVILVEDGDWRPFYPVLEVQSKAFDTYSCVSFANNNITEMMHKRLYGEEINYSDRFLSVISNTRPGVGNSHKNVAESRRTKGSVTEDVYPFTDTMSQSEFFQTIPQDIKNEGLSWTLDYEYGYEKVRRDEFDEALKLSPIQVAVDSRTNKTNQVQGLDHSVVLACKTNDKYIIFDSYLNRFVEYDLDYPFSYGQRYHYKKIVNLNYKDMSMELIKGANKPEIYLVNFDGKKFHIEGEEKGTPNAFEEYFGKTGYTKFIVKNQAEVDAMPEGKPISLKGNTLLDALKSLIQQFGKKK